MGPARAQMFMHATELTDEEYERFCGLIYRVAGIRIADNKRVLVANRVRRRLRATGIKTFSEYYAFLTSPAGAGEMPLFLDAITTNETYFYRDHQHYQWLGQTFLPEIVQQAAQRKRPRVLRIWSAACSTGEEPYSIALKVMAQEAAVFRVENQPGGDGPQRLGAGLGPRWHAMTSGPSTWSVPTSDKRFFEEDPRHERWTIKNEVGRWSPGSCTTCSSPLKEEPFDCIFLKNVLIYFDTASKQTVVRNVLAAMAKGGYWWSAPPRGSTRCWTRSPSSSPGSTRSCS